MLTDAILLTIADMLAETDKEYMVVCPELKVIEQVRLHKGRELDIFVTGIVDYGISFHKSDNTAGNPYPFCLYS